MTSTTAAPGAAGASTPRLSAEEIAERLGRPRPTPEQVAVIEAPVEPLLVVAGAGSGKTETMSSRVVWLVANGLVAPEQVLGLTFTRKAAGELAERVRKRLRALRARGLGGPAAGDGLGDGEPVVSTYHAYAASLVTDHGLRLGVEPQSTVLSEAGAWQLAAELVETWRGDLPGVEVAPSTVVEALVGLSGECAEHLVDPGALERFVEEFEARVRALPKDDKAVAKLGAHVPGEPYAEVRKVLAVQRARRSLVPLLREHARRKRDAEQLDFGDQVLLAARLAREVPAVAATERAAHRVVLLDEYQDTSYAQLALLRALFGDGHPVTAVGDPHQSIYGWRGASAGNLASFPAHFRRADDTPARVAPLATSWRNDEAVLAAANVVAAPLSAGAGASVVRLRPRPGAGTGRVRTAFAATVEEEAAEVAARLAEVWRADSERLAVERKVPGASPRPRRTAAVLCRKRSQFTVLQRALRDAGLPVQVVGLGGLLSTPEVVDVVATLHVLHDPGRGDHLARLLTGARWRLGPRDLAALGEWARHLQRLRSGRAGDDGPAAGETGEAGDPAVVLPDEVEDASLVEALDELPPPSWRGSGGRGLSPRAHARLSRLAAVLRHLRARTHLPVPELVGEVERALLLDVEVAARPGSSPASERANLDALADAAASFSVSAQRPGLGGFLSWLDAAEARERGLEPGAVEVSSDAVQLLTVHASKGLEWDVVAVPGLVEGVFPTGGETSSGWLSGLGVLPYPLRGDHAHLPVLDLDGVGTQKELNAERERFREACGQHEMDEERRLAYVAFTRAKEELLLSGAHWDDATKPRRPSRFLLEVLQEPGLPGLVSLPPVPAPAEGEENPRTATPQRVVWPVDPLAARRADVDAGARAVREAAGRASAAPAPDAEAASWAQQVELLLSERAAAGSAGGVLLPVHLSASRLVALAQDRDALALQLRRPVPLAPRPATRRGTAFHAWLEHRFTAGSLLDPEDLPGAADEDAADDRELEVLQRNYLASEWAGRDPVAVEVSVETPVAGIAVRGRIDAVFRTTGPDGRELWDVVDWKTGRPPAGEAARARDVQLAVYRLAWSRWRGVPLEDVSAAFFYASTAETVRPVDLFGAEDLERLVTSVPATDREV
ncbi:ATP-dependent helicase [Paenibacillus sp. TRM 82003]|uniref:ATP-dependent helicase n=1 Tax=Kineococcus sp. TRM81007 TaxID=2925831 RepID=UPI001F5982BA|nr:ATP-dependent DNA helicase [Kineococcus sp. TRM81007]MCI2239200.1 ATP-dependent helicase [Kineococcus sp. TRM81007]MCI3924879.1 ATP-dependent helicase [Paenibacillus sp. TRM 82003]